MMQSHNKLMMTEGKIKMQQNKPREQEVLNQVVFFFLAV
jgi:hypothetical protein